MADYLTTDTELTSIANAIRTKGGTSESLSFPTGFVDAVNAIQTGGGGAQLPVEIVIYTRNYDGTYECDHTYEDILELYRSGVPLVAVLKHIASFSGSSADTDSVAPINYNYTGQVVWLIYFEKISRTSTTTATKYITCIEHTSDGIITEKWSKKYTITFDT